MDISFLDGLWFFTKVALVVVITAAWVSTLIVGFFKLLEWLAER